MSTVLAALTAVCLLWSPLVSTAAAQTGSRTRVEWLALATGGFVVPPGETAVALLRQMTPLLASPDPALRDEVAFAAAERWILRDRLVGPDGLRELLATWSGNLDDGLDTPGDDRIFIRSFSALCLSLIAARDLATPFLSAAEVQRLTDRLLDYLTRERDRRGYDATHGWMHAVAHAADTLKFLARNPHFAASNQPRVLATVDALLRGHDQVFVWGETDRLAWTLHALLRRADADSAAFAAWTASWIEAHTALWARGPLVDPVAFARVENAKQLLRSLVAIVDLEQTPPPAAMAARDHAVAALARMR